jgi:hypothetical protein
MNKGCLFVFVTMNIQGKYVLLDRKGDMLEINPKNYG